MSTINYDDLAPYELAAILKFTADVGEYDTPHYRVLMAAADRCIELQEHLDAAEEEDPCEDCESCEADCDTCPYAESPDEELPELNRKDCTMFGECNEPGEDCRGCNKYTQDVLRPTAYNPVILVDGAIAEEIKD